MVIEKKKGGRIMLRLNETVSNKTIKNFIGLTQSVSHTVMA